MNINVTQIHKIKVTSKSIFKNFSDNILDILHDMNGDQETFENELHAFSGRLQDCRKNGFKTLFEEGFTPLLLNEDEFQYVENFFADKKDKYGEEIVVEILDDNGNVIETVEHNKIQY